jgi:galactokinase
VTAGARVRARAPGRVNLVGDHTDYTGGLVLPIAVEAATVVDGVRGGDRVVLRSGDADGVADVPLDVADPASVEPPWARYVAGVVAELRPAVGLDGTVTTDLPLGAGLGSSAALEVAVALALGFDGAAVELARACQRAEHAATGVPTGVMDQLVCAAGVAGCALLVDCATLARVPVALPAGLEVVVVDSGERRGLAATAYARRRAECEAAAALVGSLRHATLGDVEAIADPVLRRRARHVVTENGRVLSLAAALATADVSTIGAVLAASHASLGRDFEVSTPGLDALVARLAATPGVLGARLTGAGFGGCVVALAEPGSPVHGWRVRPWAGASVEVGR